MSSRCWGVLVRRCAIPRPARPPGATVPGRPASRRSAWRRHPCCTGRSAPDPGHASTCSGKGGRSSPARAPAAQTRPSQHASPPSRSRWRPWLGRSWSRAPCTRRWRPLTSGCTQPRSSLANSRLWRTRRRGIEIHHSSLRTSQWNC